MKGSEGVSEVELERAKKMDKTLECRGGGSFLVEAQVSRIACNTSMTSEL